MFDKENYGHEPNMYELMDYVNNPLLEDFEKYVYDIYKAKPIFEFSKCSMEYGWNIKFKKGSKSLCTLYPRENYFTLLIVIGSKQKERVEKLLPTFSNDIKQLYLDTKEWNNQRWLMVDMEDNDKRYDDIKKIIDIRIK